MRAPCAAAPGPGRRAAGRGGAGVVGSTPVTRRSTGTVKRGARAATASVLISSVVGCGSGLTRWNACAVEVGPVRDVVHRLGDVVDRHHVGVAEVDAHQRQPARDGVAQPLEQREEVVGAVDLVHRAGLGVPDHDGRPVDPPRHRALLADHPLGLELGAVVGGRQALADVEHRLVEDAVVVARGRDRGDLVEDPGVEGAGQVQRGPRPADVELLVELVGGGHVVERREVEEVVDPAAVLAHPALRHAQAGPGEVAGHRGHPRRVTPGVQQPLDPVPASRPGPARRSRRRGCRAAPGRGAGR